MNPPYSTLAETLDACAEAFDSGAFYDWLSEDGNCSQRQSIMCRVYESLVEGEFGCNALGNNLHEAMEDVKEFLECGPRSSKPERDIRDYLMRLYFVVEKVYDALKVIKLDHEQFKLSTDGMRAMRDIKQWANFFKHPGAFLWCHDPAYHCNSYELLDGGSHGFVLNQEAVNEYYRSDQKKHDKLHQVLENATDVHVVFPELVELTKRFCCGVHDFCGTISAPFFRDALRRKSTIDYYYKHLYDDIQSMFDQSNSQQL